MDLYTTVKQLLTSEDHEDLARLIVRDNIDDVLVDNWNDGIYNIIIKVSVNLYSSWKKSQIIKDNCDIILTAFNEASQYAGYDMYRNVTIVPDSEINDESSTSYIPEDLVSWKRGYFRMFISHLTSDKSFAASLKAKLGTIGISCFVAHEDIEPTRNWQNEIVKALMTADCLCALISSDFIKSKWCDQEVGFCLGRNIVCISLIYGSDPYGILGMSQGIKCASKDLNRIAIDIFNVLCDNAKTRDVYSQRIADLFLQSSDIETASHWLVVVEHMSEVKSNFLGYISDHYAENEVLLDSEILKKMNIILKSQKLSPIKTKELQETFNENELPF